MILSYLVAKPKLASSQSSFTQLLSFCKLAIKDNCKEKNPSVHISNVKLLIFKLRGSEYFFLFLFFVSFFFLFYAGEDLFTEEDT